MGKYFSNKNKSHVNGAGYGIQVKFGRDAINHSSPRIANSGLGDATLPEKRRMRYFEFRIDGSSISAARI
jgi:hypothetical protein